MILLHILDKTQNKNMLSYNYTVMLLVFYIQVDTKLISSLITKTSQVIQDSDWIGQKWG